jgi:hypothetical protein
MANPRTVASAPCSRARDVLGLGKVLAGYGDQFADFQLEVFDQLAAALRGCAEAVMLELGDQQLETRHQRRKRPPPTALRRVVLVG